MFLSCFRHSFDVVSAESAVRLFKDSAAGDHGYDGGYEFHEGREVAVGLTDRREYNGFVPLMDENDPLKTAVMRIFSGLQVAAPVENRFLIFFSRETHSSHKLGRARS